MGRHGLTLTAGPNGYWVDAERGHVYGISASGPYRVYGSNHAGYVRLGSRTTGRVFAHRVIWEAVNGVIPPGMEINHLNGVKDDNRIDNLELVTTRENLDHAWRTGLRQRPGNQIGETHSQAKLTEADVREIRRLSSEGVRRRVIAAQFGISMKYVSKLATRKAWPHLSEEVAA